MELITIPISSVVIKKNIRKELDIADMVKSITDRGILQPILVKREDGKYKIISGHRRYEAAKQSGEKNIQCLVGNIGEAEIPYIQLIENVQRKDLTLDELVFAFDAIKKSEEIKIGNAEIAELLGKSYTWISNKYKAFHAKQELLQAGFAESVVNSFTENELLKLNYLDDKGKMISIAKEIVEKDPDLRKKTLDNSREIKRKSIGIGQYGGFCITEKGRTVYLHFDTQEEKAEVLHVINKIRDIAYRQEYSMELDEKMKTILTEVEESFETYINKIELEENIKNAIILSHREIVKSLAGYHGYAELA